MSDLVYRGWAGRKGAEAGTEKLVFSFYYQMYKFLSWAYLNHYPRLNSYFKVPCQPGIPVMRTLALDRSQDHVGQMFSVFSLTARHGVQFLSSAKPILHLENDSWARDTMVQGLMGNYSQRQKGTQQESSSVKQWWSGELWSSVSGSVQQPITRSTITVPFGFYTLRCSGFPTRLCECSSHKCHFCSR